MKVLDLFSGIGGFSLGLERAGMETIAFCEIEDYPVSKLKKHWPNIPIARDIRKLNYNNKTKELFSNGKIIYTGTIDVIGGGFPCQPFSVAGKQRGSEDDRHLWPEMFRLIKEIRPTWVIGENVAGFIKLALDDVLTNLESEGYTTRPFVIPACAVGAIHRRDRVWIIANSNELANGKQHKYAASSQPNNSKTKIYKLSAHSESKQSNECGIHRKNNKSKTKKLRNGNRKKFSCNSKHDGWHGTENRQSHSKRNDGNTQRQNKTFKLKRSSCKRCNDANTDNSKSKRFRQHSHEILQKQKANGHNEARVRENRNKFKPIGLPTESPVCHRNDGVPDRVARLKALGNAVVPQIPEMIGRAIMEQYV